MSTIVIHHSHIVINPINYRPWSRVVPRSEFTFQNINGIRYAVSDNTYFLDLDGNELRSVKIKGIKTVYIELHSEYYYIGTMDATRELEDVMRPYELRDIGFLGFISFKNILIKKFIKQRLKDFKKFRTRL